MRGALLAVLLGAMIAAGVSCGGQKPSTALGTHLQKENEITTLWAQIRGWRREAGMDLDPSPLLISSPPRSVLEAKRVCPDGHAVPGSCNEVCSLADAICDNAEAICGLADELGKQDDFAQGKCTSAKASCREAKQRCCGCSDKTTSAAGTF